MPEGGFVLRGAPARVELRPHVDLEREGAPEGAGEVHERGAGGDVAEAREVRDGVGGGDAEEGEGAGDVELGEEAEEVSVGLRYQLWIAAGGEGWRRWGWRTRY